MGDRRVGGVGVGGYINFTLPRLMKGEGTGRTRVSVELKVDYCLEGLVKVWSILAFWLINITETKLFHQSWRPLPKM